MAVGPTVSRLRRLEKRLGVHRQVHEDDGDFELIPVETWIEGMRDLRALDEEMSLRAGGYWLERCREKERTLYAEAEAKAAAAGVGGVIKERRWLSDGARRQLDELREQAGPDRAARMAELTAELRRRRAPWPAPWRSGLEGRNA
jgi:hypothetical protein